MPKPTIYFDNASTSWPKPQRVIDAMSRFLTNEAGGPGRSGHRLAIAAERVVDGVRVKLAKLLHADEPERIIHCLNGTDALNIAIKGTLRQGDHVVCTALDHNSVSRQLEALCKTGFITRTRVDVSSDGVLDPDDVRRAITPATRLITTVHASNVTGAIQPVETIGKIATEHDAVFLLDAAQTAGVVEIDVRAIRADLVAFPGHKALLGPAGTGALYAGPRTNLRPWREGGTGADSIHPTQPGELPTRLEAGMPNTVGLAGLSAALDELDGAAILAHERKMIERLLGAITENDRIHVSPTPRSNACVGLISLSLDGLAPVDVAAILDESFGIAVRPGLHCAPYAHQAIGTFPDGTVRVAPGWSTTPEQVDQLATALQAIVS